MTGRQAGALGFVSCVAGVTGALFCVWLLRPVVSSGDTARQLVALESRIAQVEALVRARTESTQLDSHSTKKLPDTGPPEPAGPSPSGLPALAGADSSEADADVGTASALARLAEAARRTDRGRPQLMTDAARLFTSDDPTERLAAARNLADAPIPRLRLLATNTLLELDPEQGLAAVREIVAQTEDDPRSQRIAARAVLMLSDVAGVEVDEELYDYYENSTPLPRRAAARALEVRGDPRPMAEIVDDMASQLRSPDGGARSRTARQLGRTRSPSAVPVLVPLLADENSEVRRRAVEALARTGDPSVVESLTAMLEDPVPAVRTMAERSLDRLLNPRPERSELRFGSRRRGRFP